MFTKSGEEWLVLKPIDWGLGRKHTEHRVTVPNGFPFESSVPWWATWFLDPDDPNFLLAAAVHDWLLENGYRRAFADSQWYEAALSVKAPKFKREVAYTLMVIRSRFVGLKK